MKVIKRIGHWILFLIFGYLGLCLVLAIATLLPIYVGIWLFDFSDFWFYLIGSTALGIYYLIVFGGLGIFFNYLNQKKPDYWVSNIFLGFVTLIFFYNLITNLGRGVTNSKELFMNFKGIVFLISILPAYLHVLFFTIISPYIKND